ncbi:hypothetical protein VFES401_00675 [Aliivibrio fischeri]|uniref:hypothetical protein n=1 Tax=Aliivibrio fischeri TaxID=668 RepID=UPI00107EC70D|nr:hypothetical protein [Aliivibrio fischeri]TGA73260.1 hypothetical protein VFES401_00675 [Aliivibrio fischeri]
MNWFPTRNHDSKLILESKGHTKQRVIIVPKTDFNAAKAFIFSDLYDVCLENNYVPVILPPIDDQFISHFCLLIWNTFKEETSIIEQFLLNQPAFRALNLKDHILNDSDATPDIGLYDAFQLIKISEKKVVLMSEEMDMLFDKERYSLLLALNNALKGVSDSLLVGIASSSLRSSKKFGCQIYKLDDMGILTVVNHGLNMVKKVSPQLHISLLEAIECCSHCQSFEEFISKLQLMVIYQQEAFI